MHRSACTTFLFSGIVGVVFLMGCGRDSAPSAAVEVPVAVESKSDDQDRPAREDRLPVLGEIPPFSLVDQSGEIARSSKYYGKVWLANFIFTRCTSTCPQQTMKLADLSDRLKTEVASNKLRLVSFTVDPEFDTPAILSRYSETRRIDHRYWDFLTGPRQDLWELCRQGFKLPVQEDVANVAMPILHSSQFVLVDQLGRVRGYYNGISESSLNSLKRDVKSLIAELKPVPDEIMSPPWLDERARRQREQIKESSIFHQFSFADHRGSSGIGFVNRVVPDAAKRYQATHYDHGNGVAAADVDGDGLIDLYFVSQLGGHQLWKNMGGGIFQDMTETAGVALKGRIGVTASFGDLDNDGDPDLFVTTVRGGNVLFRNEGNGKFTDVTAVAEVGHVGHSSAAVLFDYDRDGLLDIFVCNVGAYSSNELAPEGYHVAFPDAFAGHLKPEERNEKSILYRNLGNLKFADVTTDMKLVDESWSGDATPLDANQDGWIDLYILNMQGHNEYYENIGGKEFRKRSRELFPKTPWGAMGVKVFDFDNDGQLDIYITDMHSDMSQQVGPDREKEKSQMVWPESLLQTKGESVWGNALYRKLGPDSYTEISDQVGAENYWPWGLSVGDLNADGFDDVFITASMNFPFRYAVNSLLLNEAGKRFVDAEFVVGVEPRSDGRTALPWFEVDCSGADEGHLDCEGRTGHLTVWSAIGSRSSVIFDLDNDGDLDIVTNDFGSEPLVLISNLSDQQQLNYLKLTLIGKGSNRDGCGAVVAIKTADQRSLKVHDGKSGYLSQSVLPLYFGLGTSTVVEQIEVHWPSGRSQTVAGPITANQSLVIQEE
ncbi:FG-GAP-like repeat-containing protein [Schlesneria sp. T3-172]|uniref:FG-GAP-like repeat-containing protein n=1 Tax=Schlesneria sphaerica TaxID=3373610 RepID=UPI0037CAB56F